MPRAFKPSILTANHLIEGDVIYYTDTGNWSRVFADAYLFEDEAAAKTALVLAESDAAQIVGAYLVEVESEDGALKPAHFREDFRATGPSNYHHGKQETQDV